MPEPTLTETWYDAGCRRSCSEQHTYTWGDCALAPESAKPEPRVTFGGVRTMDDGQPGIVLDSYTVAELAARIERVIRTVPVRLGPNALAMLQRAETVGLSGGEYSAMALAVAMDLAEQATEPGPAEHCIHDRGIHHRHHTTPVDGCPWCEDAGTRVEGVETGGLT